MIIIPAIDLKDGQCVRLLQGRAEDASVVADDAVETALRWQTAGAKRLHMVDLDGAFEGKRRNLAVVEEVTKAIRIPVELGGGIRDMAGIEAVFAAGVQWAILGTVAIEQPEFVAEAVRVYGDRILVGIDARDGMVAVRGWLKGTAVSALDLAKQVRDAGVREIIYTDIARDGMLQGPNLESLSQVAAISGLQVIASGGVSSLVDLERISRIAGVSGAIVGKALYSGHVDLAEAIACIEDRQ
ncbi:MAG TPA: 1-(5-phosphoribosyl)-5-[(5-phosphoribosylamino)methylideneamino]imidazole-4-carboxamide isomerase [Firmicutes bacterium]|nr:1-(5-phosphoribosyl)-5-[(5-phosphoribosylamino)methylideneamino]imidazole-4-carboxamide isomerase [Bacillota bacterium]